MFRTPSRMSPTTTWWGALHFTDEETEAQRDARAHLWGQSGKVAELEFKLSST